MPLTVDEADAVLAGNFAPWVQALGLHTVSVDGPTAVLRLPWSKALAREGGALSGQAIMAAADTATVIAISSASGTYRPMTTVQQSVTFRRPVIDADVLFTATVNKLGRSMAFTDIDAALEGTGAQVAQASTVYALLG
ncbi:hypothetical protein Afil01_15580 [Actinorhabdospora filicis]|uniref:Thioesterase domain-containing protein n=1 Tax=Actinorhabdospora filicis TaxID=1785913 RepID=A0A9W6SLE5_9ACTN|nr:PaaI family thioesterase [Actinorhabdospora filicis]GLZ76751.1 hypothetical protein Afil01_15580 [Actinorhabdospora filicis]